MDFGFYFHGKPWFVARYRSLISNLMISLDLKFLYPGHFSQILNCWMNCENIIIKNKVFIWLLLLLLLNFNHSFRENRLTLWNDYILQLFT